MNPILERTYQSLALIKNSLLVQACLDKSFTYFGLYYECEIFSTIPVRTLQKDDRLQHHTNYTQTLNQKLSDSEYFFAYTFSKNTQQQSMMIRIN